MHKENWLKYHEELFFLMYHLHIDGKNMPSNERRWLIQKFIETKR